MNRPTSDDFEFVSEKVNKDYFCPVSLEVMMNPHQTDCCGCHISAGVAERLIKEGKPCPLCKASSSRFPHRTGDKVFTTHRDQYFQRIILDQKVCCPHHRNNGCEWIGLLREVQDHSASCGFRPWMCQYCRYSTSYKIGTTEHAQICPLRPVLCSCSSNHIPFNKLEEHKRVCPVEVVACEFADVGCTAKVHRNSMADHMQSSMAQHHMLVSRKTLSMMPAIQSTNSNCGPKHGMEESSQQLKDKDAKILELKNKVVVLGADLNSARMEVLKLQQEMHEKSSSEVRDLIRELRLKKDTGSQVSGLQDREEISQQLKDKDAKILKLKEKVVVLSSDLNSAREEMLKLQKEMRENSSSDVRELLEELRLKEDTELQFNRLKDQIKSQEEQIQNLQQKEVYDVDAETIISNVGIMVTDVLEKIRSKKSLGDKDVKKVVSGLEEVMTAVTERNTAREIDESSLEGFVDASPDKIAEAKKYEGFRGNLERTLISGLKRAGGVTAVGEDVYVVDTNGRYGVRVISNGLARDVIESASFSDVHIPSGKCWYPRCVALDKEGNLFLSDTGSHRILKFTANGKLLAQVGKESNPGSSTGLFDSPLGITLDANENVYVCDQSNHRIVMLTSELQWVSTFGRKGHGQIEFHNPWDIAFDFEGNIYIADCGNRCVKVFNSEFSPLKTVGKNDGKKYKNGDMRAPNTVCVDSKGNIYVADGQLKQVLVYNSSGECVRSFGKFIEPCGISVDARGNLYVSDNGGQSSVFSSGRPGRVQVYT